MRLNNQAFHVRIASSEDRIESSAKEQQLLLKSLKDEVDENSMHIRAGNAVASDIARRLEWVRNLGQDIKKFLQGIFMTTYATYRLVLDIRDRLPSHLERSLYQEPFILEDSHGRIFPIPMQFVNSWEAFDAVLGMRFVNLPGHKMVQRKDYVLHESAANRDIERSRPWEGAFFPGQRIVMCMLFVDSAESKSCPRCFYMPADTKDSDINW